MYISASKIIENHYNRLNFTKYFTYILKVNFKLLKKCQKKKEFTQEL